MAPTPQDNARTLYDLIKKAEKAASDHTSPDYKAALEFLRANKQNIDFTWSPALLVATLDDFSLLNCIARARLGSQLLKEALIAVQELNWESTDPTKFKKYISDATSLVFASSLLELMLDDLREADKLYLESCNSSYHMCHHDDPVDLLDYSYSSDAIFGFASGWLNRIGSTFQRAELFITYFPNAFGNAISALDDLNVPNGTKLEKNFSSYGVRLFGFAVNLGAYRLGCKLYERLEPKFRTVDNLAKYYRASLCVEFTKDTVNLNLVNDLYDKLSKLPNYCLDHCLADSFFLPDAKRKEYLNFFVEKCSVRSVYTTLERLCKTPHLYEQKQKIFAAALANLLEAIQLTGFCE
jgi:hypothetical protein